MTILISRKKIDARVDSMVEKVTNVSILLFWFQTLNSSVVNDACIMSAALRPAWKFCNVVTPFIYAPQRHYLKVVKVDFTRNFHNDTMMRWLRKIWKFKVKCNCNAAGMGLSDQWGGQSMMTNGHLPPNFWWSMIRSSRTFQLYFTTTKKAKGKKDLEFSETLSEFSFHKRGFFRFKLENRPIASALLTLAPVTLTFPPF